jgi:hypothetical protein
MYNLASKILRAENYKRNILRVHEIKKKMRLANHKCSDLEKVKVKLSQCLTKHHAMKKYWGVEV